MRKRKGDRTSAGRGDIPALERVARSSGCPRRRSNRTTSDGGTRCDCASALGVVSDGQVVRGPRGIQGGVTRESERPRPSRVIRPGAVCGGVPAGECVPGPNERTRVGGDREGGPTVARSRGGHGAAGVVVAVVSDRVRDYRRHSHSHRSRSRRIIRGISSLGCSDCARPSVRPGQNRPRNGAIPGSGSHGVRHRSGSATARRRETHGRPHTHGRRTGYDGDGRLCAFRHGRGGEGSGTRQRSQRVSQTLNLPVIGRVARESGTRSPREGSASCDRVRGTGHLRSKLGIRGQVDLVARGIRSLRPRECRDGRDTGCAVGGAGKNGALHTRSADDIDRVIRCACGLGVRGSAWRVPDCKSVDQRRRGHIGQELDILRRRRLDTDRRTVPL